MTVAGNPLGFCFVTTCELVDTIIGSQHLSLLPFNDNIWKLGANDPKWYNTAHWTLKRAKFVSLPCYRASFAMLFGVLKPRVDVPRIHTTSHKANLCLRGHTAVSA